MNFKNLKISQKVFLSFLIIIALLLITSIFQIYNFSRLTSLNANESKRSKDAIYISENSAIGAEAYRIIADAIINKNKNQSLADWDANKRAVERKYQVIENLVDTKQEEKWLQETKDA